MAEVIKNDFGEDLIVQSQLKDTADSFSILVQVKGARLRRGKDGKVRYKADIDHLLRWVSHYQPVLVCVYDDATQQVYSFFPKELFSLWRLMTANTKTLTISMDETNKFWSGTAAAFIWRCRINYYDRTLSWYESAQPDIEYLVGPGKRRRLDNLEREKGIVALDFLKSIGVVEDDAMVPEFVASVKNCSASFGKSNGQNDSEKFQMDDVFHLCLLGHVDREIGGGLPATLLGYGALVANKYFAILYPELWNQAAQRLEPA